MGENLEDRVLLPVWDPASQNATREEKPRKVWRPREGDPMSPGPFGSLLVPLDEEQHVEPPTHP